MTLTIRQKLGSVGALTILMVSSSFAGPQDDGLWSEPFEFDWPVNRTNTLLTPQGNILSIGIESRPFNLNLDSLDVWNPELGTGENSHSTISDIVSNIQNATYTSILMPNGNVLIAGLDSSFGQRLDSLIFNTQTNAISTTTGSAYTGQSVFPPDTSSTILPSGEIVIGGNVFANGDSPLEIYSPITDQWRTLTDAPRDMVSWVIPNGEVLLETTSFLDPSGNGSVTPNEDASLLNYYTPGSLINPNPVMYRPGKLFWVGGNLSQYGADSAAVEFNGRAISVKTINSPRSYSVRYSPKTILLPTGNVLSVSALEVDDARPEDRLEIWNASTENWSLMADTTLGATSTEVVLLKDGRVLALVGDEAKTFSPPYLFNSSGDLAERPEVLSAPSVGTYADQITVKHGAGNVISRVTLVSAGRFDDNHQSVGQRFIELDFYDTADGVNANLPESANIAPPGYYIMSLIDNQGVPSGGHMISLNASDQNTSGFPKATADYVTATGSDIIVIDALANDTGTSLTLNAPNAWSLQGGNVALLGNKLTYKPKAGFSGQDKIWYSFVDAQGRGDSGEITITVSNNNNKLYPTATEDIVSSTGSGMITIDALANDSGSGLILDTPNAWSLKGGNVALVSNKISYKPKASFNGEDKIWYTFKDSQGRANSGVVTITVTSNPIYSSPYPTAVEDNVTVGTGITATLDVLANDIGTVLMLNAPNTWSLNGGSVSLIGNKLSYTSKSGFIGNDKIWYTFKDAENRINSGQVNITVDKAVPDFKAIPDYFITTLNTGINLDILANDTGSDKTRIHYLYEYTEKGGKTYKTPEGQIWYTPKEGFTGEDNFWYVMTDSQGRTDSAKVVITVNNNKL